MQLRSKKNICSSQKGRKKIDSRVNCNNIRLFLYMLHANLFFYSVLLIPKRPDMHAPRTLLQPLVAKSRGSTIARREASHTPHFALRTPHTHIVVLWIANMKQIIWLMNKSKAKTTTKKNKKTGGNKVNR